MAKKRRRAVSRSTVQAAEQKIGGFAEDLGRLLVEARRKAEGWLGQRKVIGQHLAGIRDTATSLLGQLGDIDQPKPTRAPVKSAAVSAGTAGAKGGSRTRRTMSAEARARIAEAQRRRWARLKRNAK
jgi:hypothetical protein